MTRWVAGVLMGGLVALMGLPGVCAPAHKAIAKSNHAAWTQAKARLVGFKNAKPTWDLSSFAATDPDTEKNLARLKARQYFTTEVLPSLDNPQQLVGTLIDPLSNAGYTVQKIALPLERFLSDSPKPEDRARILRSLSFQPLFENFTQNLPSPPVLFYCIADCTTQHSSQAQLMVVMISDSQNNQVLYKYLYPSGKLAAVEVDASPENIYIFNPDKTLISHQTPKSTAPKSKHH